VKQWGQKNDVQVNVEHINNTLLDTRAAAEVAAQNGHDLFMAIHPMAQYEDQVINHAPIIQEIEHKVGKYGDLGRLSTYNLKTKKYFAVSDCYVPDPVIWRHDLWNGIGEAPFTWDHVRKAAPKLKALGHPIGIGQSQELDSNMALIAFLMCFGSFIQNDSNRPTLNSKNTIEAVKFMADIFKSGETDEIFGWTPASNNNFMYSGKGSMILNAISATRTPEDLGLPFSDQLYIYPIPKGPVQRLGLEHVIGVLLDLEVRAEHRGGQEVHGRPRDQLQGRLRRVEVLQLPDVPGRASLQEDPEAGGGRHAQAARQVPDPRDHRAEVHGQPGLSGPHERRVLRGVRQVPDPEDVRPGLAGQDERRRRGQRCGP